MSSDQNNITPSNGVLDTIVTIFPDIVTPWKPYHITVGKIFDRIRSGKSSAQISTIRTTTDKKERHELKKKLPSICFSGKFKKRENDQIEEHSGLICLDFDHLDPVKMEKFKTALKADRYIFSFFTSPSGDGVKVIVKIPKDIPNHSKYASSLGLYFQKESEWDDLKDIARACYESHDPEIYVNEDSKVFDILLEPKPSVIENVSDTEKLKDPHLIYNYAKRWSEKTDTYKDGNKYRFLVRLVCACNRFGLEDEFVVNRIKNDYQDKASWVDSKDFEHIVRTVYVKYRNHHGISAFTVKGEMRDYDPSGRARDVIYMDDIREEMLRSFTTGDSRGETTHFKTIDRHWTWKRGDLNLMHGLPNQGKSILMMQLMLLKSIHEGKKWGIFSPEQNPPIDFYKDLIHMYIGKSTEPYHKHRMSHAEFNKGMDFMSEHFYFLYPKDDSPTPQYINDRFSELIIKHSIDGCVIDPFNQLDNDWASAGGRDDQYIAAFGSKQKRFALTNDIYQIIIAHPKGGRELLNEKNQYAEFKNAGNYGMPALYDLAGGAMWGNKMDNVLVTYQPYYNSRLAGGHIETIKHPRLTQFVSQKIKKHKLTGIPGSANLIFNAKQNRFYEENGYEEYSEHSDEMMRGLPKEGIYSPFDTEYKESIIKENLNKVIDEKKWSNFKQIEVENAQNESLDNEEEEVRYELPEPPDNLSSFEEPDYEEHRSDIDDDNPF